MRPGPAMIVQRGDFVIASGCGPLENLIRCGFANELLAGEPKNLTHVRIGFGRASMPEALEVLQGRLAQGR